MDVNLISLLNVKRENHSVPILLLQLQYGYTKGPFIP